MCGIFSQTNSVLEIYRVSEFIGASVSVAHLHVGPYSADYIL